MREYSPHETPEHVQALLRFRDRSMEVANDGLIKPPLISDPLFLEAVELLIKSKKPYSVATNGDLSPFMAFNGEPTTLGEQWFISREHAGDVISRIERHESVEDWEYTFARLEQAFIRQEILNIKYDSSQKMQREVKTYLRALILMFVVAIGLLIWRPEQIIGLYVMLGIIFIFFTGVFAWSKFDQVRDSKRCRDLERDLDWITMQLNVSKVSI